MIGSGVLHGGMPRDCRYECIVFDPLVLKNSATEQVLQELFDGEISVHPLLPLQDTALKQTLEELFDVMEHPEGAGRLLVLSALYRLFGSVLRNGYYDGHPEKSRATRRKMMQLKRALTYIEEHFSEQVTLEQIAAQAEMSPRYFCRFFQELTHRSPIEYLNYYRVEKAGDRFLHSVLSVTEIAYSCGFNDLSYFIRVFKKQKGVTPKKYEETQLSGPAGKKFRSFAHTAEEDAKMNPVIHTKKMLQNDLSALGIRPGDTVLMHSSFRSLGGIEGGATGFFEAFTDLLGSEGTLILPALSYKSVTRQQPVFHQDQTPSCVGYLPEFFRTQVPGVIRSLHPTHSCCLLGKYARELAEGHELDDTPVGRHSPFAKLPLIGGKILMLGCGLDCNTSMGKGKPGYAHHYYTHEIDEKRRKKSEQKQKQKAKASDTSP